jgi:carboxypeptidase Taq
MSEHLDVLKRNIARIGRLGEAGAIVSWDQQTYMPEGAGRARAEQLAALSEVMHEMFTSDETGAQLARAEAEIAGADPDSDEARMVANIRRRFDLSTKLPTWLVSELSRQQALGHEVWVKARATNDFGHFLPALEKIFDLTRQRAEFLGYQDHIYDALLDEYEQGAKHADIAKMFEDMKPGTVALTKAIGESEYPVDQSPLLGDFPADKQSEVTLKVVELVGFDLKRGRQDVAAHPFCSNASRDDVRLTTRFDPGYLGQALYASLHEAGHGMYEQGSPEAYEGTALSGGVSLGVHESQSRFWENIIGRSRAFCHFLFPILQEAFPYALGMVSVEAFYRAVNRVKPSLIRVEADEVTYNLHILLRFEMESDLLTGKLGFKDVPDAWNAKMESYLGVTPPSDAQGCLQDIHWSEGLIGYFPTYSLGNLLSSQLFHAMQGEVSNIPELLERGETAPILDWLRRNVHGYGSKFTPPEVVRKATGEPLTSKYYVDYLTEKYTDIYHL